MEIGEIIAALGAHVADEDGGVDEDKLKAVVKDMRAHESSHVKAIAQRLANAGGKIEKGKADTRIKALEKEVETLTEARDDLQEKIEAGKGQPSEKEADLQKRLDKAEQKLATVTAERDTERQGRQQDTVSLVKSSFLGHLKGRVDDFGLKAIDRMYGDRFRPKEGGGVEVLDEDGEVIEPPKGKTAEEVLAEHAFATVPDSNRVRQMNPGAGVNGKGALQAPTVDQIAQEKASSREYGGRY
jgi:hypothetical protein